MATIIIGSAKADEKGKATGGAIGDQKQTSASDFKGEVSMQTMYMSSKGWLIFRPKSAFHATRMAESMKRACNNANIGYDQYNRLSIIKHGTGTTVKTECDCSSLVRQCIKEATGIDVGDFYTGNQPEILDKSGLFEERIAYISQAKTPVYNGDILVTKSKGHTVIVVSGNPRKVVSSSSASSSSAVTGGKYMFEVHEIEKGNNGKEVKLLQRLLVGHGYSVGKSGVDGSFGGDTEKAVKAFQTKYGLEVDCIVGPKTWKMLLGI